MQRVLSLSPQNPEHLTWFHFDDAYGILLNSMATTCAYINCGEVALFACCRQKINLIGLSKGQTTHKQNIWRVSNCSGEQAENKNNATVNERVARTLVLERYNNETTKRYMLDRDSRLQVVDEVHKEMTSHDKNGVQMSIQNLQLPSIIKAFVLPAGYPGSVSDDYIEYMLWQFPTNVTAWICKTIVTSSLLKAVGIDSLPGSTATATTAAAATAAIKWVSKDGVGALGRLLIGGRFGGLFDDDPKQWRMYADFIGSAGSVFELATPLVPEYFLPLASLGNLTKAIARGLKDPSFRVIQNHFAVSGNLGDVAAKEEVWEVGGQLIGLSLGVFILASPQLLTSYQEVALTWMSLRLLHLWLRYQTLAVLRFSTINLKRARLLVERHVSGFPIPGADDCNRQENILIFEQLLKPRIYFGCSLEMLIGTKMSGSKLEALLDLYRKEKYILIVTTNPLRGKEACIAFKVGATSITVLRSIWQTYWLCVHEELFNDGDHFALSSKENVLEKDSCHLTNHLMESLLKLDENFDDFLCQLENAGWDVKQLALKVPTKVTIIEEDEIEDENSIS